MTDLDLILSRNPDQPLEQINLGYSTKNIPTCSEKQYIQSLIPEESGGQETTLLQDKVVACPPLETPVSYEENLR